jgi:hypothetical protein
VHPEEERRLQPGGGGEGGVGRRLGLALGDLPVGGIAGAQIVVVETEPLVQPVTVRQDDGRDHRGRVVAVGGEALGQRLHPVGEDERAVVPHAGARRIEPGQDRGMARQGDRSGGVATHEAGAPGGEGVEVGRPRRLPAIGPEVVGAGGVQRDQDEVAAQCLRTGRGLAGPGGSRQPAGDRPGEKEEDDPRHDPRPGGALWGARGTHAC